MSGGVTGGKQYRTDPVDTEQEQVAKQIKTGADVLAHSIGKLRDSPARAQALMRLEEAVMWATRGGA